MWIIDGLLSKVNDVELMNYLRENDIFGLVETLISDRSSVNNLFSDFDCHFCSALKHLKHGRSMAGIKVYVRKSVARFVKRICDDATFGIFLIIDKNSFQREKDVLLCILYLPPERSPFYKKSQYEGIPLLEDHLLSLEINIDLYDVLIMGDLNARTDVGDDFLSTDKIVPELEEYRDILNDDCSSRVSCDKVVNKFGSDLSDFCKSSNP